MKTTTPATDESRTMNTTPLLIIEQVFHAIESEDLLSLKSFIRGGHTHQASPTLQTTPLIWAAMCGSLKSLQLLLPVSDANAKEKGAGQTALMWAVCNGHLNCVKALLPWSRPEDVTARGDTLLMLAARGGHLDCLQWLIPLSNVQAKNLKGQTAFEQAVVAGHLGCVEALLPHVLLFHEKEPFVFKIPRGAHADTRAFLKEYIQVHMERQKLHRVVAKEAPATNPSHLGPRL